MKEAISRATTELVPPCATAQCGGQKAMIDGKMHGFRSKYEVLNFGIFDGAGCAWKAKR
jgi:hypothetical protein